MALRPVVVTGLGIICAAGRDPAEFWTRLTTARGGLTPIEDEAFAVFTARYAGQVPDAWIDDQLPAEEAAGDRTARLALVAANQAIEQAGRPGRAGAVRAAPAPDRFGVILGKCQATPGPGGSYQPMHHTADVVAERLGLGGPRILVSTACAAGGNAVGLARDKILTGEADAVLAGGVDPLLFGTYAGFAGLQALSTGPCRPYSHSDGLNLGEGAAFLLLEPLDLALARGATPLAEVAGYGLSADAYHATAPDPTGRGGAGAVRRALAEAGLTPDDVHYVSGHGTGTPANDTMEAKVMRLVFGDRASRVPTSSIKSFVGHTLGAAGAVEAVASVLALRHGVVPPTIGFDDDGDGARADLDYVPNRAREMTVDTVVSNNYAFGGNNVSLVLTRPRDPAPYGPAPRREAVISGLGPVTCAGTGIAETAAAITAGRRADGRAPSLEGRTFAPRSLWRHMNRLSRLAIAASRLAWEDADLKLPRKALDDVALVFATGAGSAESTGGFDDSIALNPNKPAVLSFSNVVLNATGGAVCQTLGLRGPTTTLCNGAASASIALDCALEMIDAGKAEVVLVVAADETAARQALASFELLDASGAAGDAGPSGDGGPVPYGERPAPPAGPEAASGTGAGPGAGAGAASGIGPVAGSAAVAFVVESAEHCAGRGGRPYARVAGTRHAAGRGAEPVARSLALPGAAPALVVGAATGLPRDGEEAAAVLARVPDALLTASAALIGDCQAATGAMNIALAALAVRDGLAPALAGLGTPLAGGRDSYVTAPELDGPVESALALTAAHDSVRGAVLLEAV
ncbi:beta-ketoacyl-[acyl-carrier-protein] synthase family protein [Streptosporangium sp. NPDC023615]|uniref:beta-ketoacyl-[acyl-carrier-protein] synthase family protein n=1 Tax=Streptosporangium sp. NPDC023615 TaxID=3154794 RepID=UPI003434711F